MSPAAACGPLASGTRVLLLRVPRGSHKTVADVMTDAAIEAGVDARQFWTMPADEFAEIWSRRPRVQR